MASIQFTVLGVPQPRGNKTAFPFQRKDGSLGVNVTDGRRPKSRAASAGWMDSVRFAAASEQQDSPPIEGPVEIDIAFELVRPKSRKSAKAHTTRPDIDKLARGTLDAMKGIIYRDDSQIVSLRLWKSYAKTSPGARITVSGAEQ